MQTQSKTIFPPQHQDRHPGHEAEMNPPPCYDDAAYKPAQKLMGKTALITGGDSGIGRAVAVAFAKEGANCVIVHLNENDDAQKTLSVMQNYGSKGMSLSVDLRNENDVLKCVKQVINAYGKIDILVNNAAVQYPRNSLADISSEQWGDTFDSNVSSYFYMTKAVLGYLKRGDVIINTTSITAFKGSAGLIDYASTKGAIVSFTRSMAVSLAAQGIRVNAVAPGPVWTPLIVSSFSPEIVSTFGSTAPLGGAAQPCDLAPAYVFLACDDSKQMTGEVLQINGGEIIN